MVIDLPFRCLGPLAVPLDLFPSIFSCPFRDCGSLIFVCVCHLCLVTLTYFFVCLDLYLDSVTLTYLEIYSFSSFETKRRKCRLIRYTYIWTCVFKSIIWEYCIYGIHVYQVINQPLIKLFFNYIHVQYFRSLPYGLFSNKCIFLIWRGESRWIYQFYPCCLVIQPVFFLFFLQKMQDHYLH